MRTSLSTRSLAMHQMFTPASRRTLRRSGVFRYCTSQQHLQANLGNDDAEEHDMYMEMDAGDLGDFGDPAHVSASEDSEPDSEGGDEPAVSAPTQIKVRKAFLRHFAAGGESRSRRLATAADTLRGFAEATPKTCPECGESTACGGRKCPVTIITWEQPVLAQAAVGWCSNCSVACNLLPVQVDCMSDSNSGWDLSRAHSDKPVLWWHQSVLQMYDIFVGSWA